MTMQAVLVGTDGIVLASDLKWAHNNLPVRPSHLSPKIKIGSRGDLAVSCARSMEVSEPIADAILELDVEAWSQDPIPLMRLAAQSVIDRFERKDAHCLVVSSRPTPRAYKLQSVPLRNGSWSVACQLVEGHAVAGDNNNAAIFWIERYYQKQATDVLLPLAAQLVYAASRLNSAAIGGLEIALCSDAGISRLSREKTDELTARAKTLDESLETIVMSAGDITTDKDKFDALLGKMLATPPLPKDSIPKKRKPRKPRA